jgi:hypothetical protein
VTIIYNYKSVCVYSRIFRRGFLVPGGSWRRRRRRRRCGRVEDVGEIGWDEAGAEVRTAMSHGAAHEAER